ncbi:uncharacterized protein LOC133176979 [Saccostrea echinata]|uniref:uncharacterized protein LOC133176979 n=1 Tax=Saccostrea echinata TaxID=191078 RepID=UPI002A7EDCB0|nr:uncharacterized protein LOC133176979 [Saccostrea echinata]
MLVILLSCFTLILSSVHSAHYIRLGCMKEIPGRLLRAKAGVLKLNSPWHCEQFCQGYTYFGVQYSKECFCGNQLIFPITPSTACTMACEGNRLLVCGGSYAIDVYQRVP